MIFYTDISHNHAGKKSNFTPIWTLIAVLPWLPPRSVVNGTAVGISPPLELATASESHQAPHLCLSRFRVSALGRWVTLAPESMVTRWGNSVSRYLVVFDPRCCTASPVTMTRKNVYTPPVGWRVIVWSCPRYFAGPRLRRELSPCGRLHPPSRGYM